MDEDIGATSITLAADDLRQIDATAAKISLQGARDPEASQKLDGLLKKNGAAAVLTLPVSPGLKRSFL